MVLSKIPESTNFKEQDLSLGSSGTQFLTQWAMKGHSTLKRNVLRLTLQTGARFIFTHGGSGGITALWCPWQPPWEQNSWVPGYHVLLASSFIHSTLYAFRLLHFLALRERGYRSLLHQHVLLGLKCSLRSKFPPRVIILISISGIVTLGQSSSRLVALVVILYPLAPHCLTLWNVTYQPCSQLQSILFLLIHSWLLPDNHDSEQPAHF